MRLLPGEHVSSTVAEAVEVEDYYSRLQVPVAETQAVIYIFFRKINFENILKYIMYMCVPYRFYVLPHSKVPLQSTDCTSLLFTVTK